MKHEDPDTGLKTTFPIDKTMTEAMAQAAEYKAVKEQEALAEKLRIMGSIGAAPYMPYPDPSSLAARTTTRPETFLGKDHIYWLELLHLAVILNIDSLSPPELAKYNKALKNALDS